MRLQEPAGLVARVFMRDVKTERSARMSGRLSSGSPAAVTGRGGGSPRPAATLSCAAQGRAEGGDVPGGAAGGLEGGTGAAPQQEPLPEPGGMFPGLAELLLLEAAPAVRAGPPRPCRARRAGAGALAPEGLCVVGRACRASAARVK